MKIKEEPSFCSSLGKLMCNIPFVMIILANSFIYFVLTGIQYWVTDYLINFIGEAETTVLTTFSIVSVTGPVLGVVIGGNVTSCLGGFRSRSALLMTILVAILCFVSAFPIPFTSEFIPFVVCLWFLLFFGGYMMPALSGIMIELIPDDLKAVGNAIANLSYNLLGFLPAPSVYGFIYDYGVSEADKLAKKGNAREAMGSLMFVTVIPLVTILVTAAYIFKNDPFDYSGQKEKNKKSQKGVSIN